MNKILKPDWSYQDNAVETMTRKIEDEKFIKSLIVIPTGGGKTITAIKIINNLIKRGYFKNEEKVMWVVHTKALFSQAEKEISSDENIKKFNLSSKLRDVLNVKMKDEARKIIASPESSFYKIIIIDEAHHAGATTYQDFFIKDKVVLGLTATPGRSDDVELPYDSVGYSITFRDLILRGVILEPKIETITSGMEIDATSLNMDKNDDNFQKFNTIERNDFIAEQIIKRRKFIKKVLVFVATNKHAEELFNALRVKNKFYGEPFEHIGFINGATNEKKIDNNSYLDQHKRYKTSVLVNCKLLNEGYDDPSIDTVVMATPTNSVLYYMQCIGRVVRSSANTEITDAHVIEICDKLPNISYRIDNRWLYAEISDYLHPKIFDLEYKNQKNLVSIIHSKFSEYCIEPKYYEKICSSEKNDSCSLLLFNDSIDSKYSQWKPILFCDEDSSYINIFNEVSNQIERFRNMNFDYLAFNLLKIDKNDFYFSDPVFRKSFFSSLVSAYAMKKLKSSDSNLLYFTFRQKSRNNWLVLIFVYIKMLIRKIFN